MMSTQSDLQRILTFIQANFTFIFLPMSFKRIRGSPKPYVTFRNKMDVYGGHLTVLV